MYDKTDLNICLVIVIKKEYTGIISKHYNFRKFYWLLWENH